jgi:sugar phosphate isomerase/epimerase
VAAGRHGLELPAWWIGGLDDADPFVAAMLELLARHGLRPQLWAMQRLDRLVQGLRRLLPASAALPLAPEQAARLPDAIKAGIAAVREAWHAEDLATTPEEQERCVEREADRVQALVELAAPCGCDVLLYNHNGWLGMVENQLAVIERLARRGVGGVGIAYNFSHARDARHDDTVAFPALWERMKPYVGAVNVSGTASEGTIVPPGSGDRELEMLRAIEDSGWSGAVGLIAEAGGDAEQTLAECRHGFERLRTELASQRVS